MPNEEGRGGSREDWSFLILHSSFIILHSVPAFPSMSDIDTDRLICIVVGVQLRAELGDRPLAYRIEQELRQRLEAALGKPAEGEPPRLAPVVLSDVYYLNNDE